MRERFLSTLSNMVANDHMELSSTRQGANATQEMNFSFKFQKPQAPRYPARQCSSSAKKCVSPSDSFLSLAVQQSERNLVLALSCNNNFLDES